MTLSMRVETHELLFETQRRVVFKVQNRSASFEVGKLTLRR